MTNPSDQYRLQASPVKTHQPTTRTLRCKPSSWLQIFRGKRWWRTLSITLSIVLPTTLAIAVLMVPFPFCGKYCQALSFSQEELHQTVIQHFRFYATYALFSDFQLWAALLHFVTDIGWIFFPLTSPQAIWPCHERASFCWWVDQHLQFATQYLETAHSEGPSCTSAQSTQPNEPFALCLLEGNHLLFV